MAALDDSGDWEDVTSPVSAEPAAPAATAAEVPATPTLAAPVAAAAPADDWQDLQPQTATPAAGAAAPTAAGDDWEDVPQWRGYLPVAGAAFARGAITGTGAAIAGAPELAADYNHRVLANLDRIDRGERLKNPLTDDPLGYQEMDPEMRKQVRADVERAAAAYKPEETALYKAGHAVENFAKDTFQLSADEENSITAHAAGTVGGMVPFIATAPLVSPPVAIGLGMAQMGLAGAHEHADAARAKGATPEQAAEAARMGFYLGAGSGALPLHVVMRPVERLAPGIADWARARLQHAAENGIVFATTGEAQLYLGQEIAQNYYDPEAGYAPDVKRVLGTLLGGGFLGAVKPTPYRGGAEKPAAVPADQHAAALQDILGDQPSDGGKPIRAASADDTGGAPINSSGEAPPSTQPSPGFQDSILPEPSSASTTREMPPSILDGPATIRFSDFPLGDMEPTSNKNILQGTNDYNALVAAAAENKPKLEQSLTSLVADIPGAEFYSARVKDVPGLVEKIESKNRPASTISDYLGARIIVDTPDDLQRVIGRLNRTGGVVEAEDFIPSSKVGYRAYHMQVGLGDGTSAELQLVPRPIANVMEEAHDIRQPVKRLDISKPEDFKQFKETMAFAQAIFDQAWTGSEAWHGYGESALLGQPVDGIQPHRVTAANGTAIGVTPIVVEAGSLRTSQDRGYDQSLQPRQRDRAASQAQVRDIASNLDPERLGYSSEADRGAPIIGPDGIVESGNGRILALRHAYDEGGLSALAYRDWLTNQGVDVAKYQNPVLVRQRTTPMDHQDRQAFTVAANQAATLTMSAPERAMADAQILDGRSITLIRSADDLGALANRDFVRHFVSMLPQTEQGMMADSRGALSAEGLARLRNAVLGKAYGDAGVLARIAESTNDEIRSISNALMAAAPDWAKLRGDVETGRVRPDMDVTPDLLEAVKRTADIRGRNDKLETYLAQQDAFDRIPGPVEGFMRMFYDPKGQRAASSKRITDALRFYAEEARKVSADEGLGLGLVPVKARDIMGLATAKEFESYGEPGISDRGGLGDGAGGEAGGPQTRGPWLGESGREAAQRGDVGGDGAEVRAQRPDRPFSLRNLTTVPGTEPVKLAGGDIGDQYVLPGAEKISGAEMMRRRAAAPMTASRWPGRSRGAPRPEQGGLFGDDAQQLDLVTEAARPAPKPAEAPLDNGNQQTQITAKAEPADAPGREPQGDGIRPGTPEVPGREPARRARRATPAGQLEQLSLFGGGPGERSVLDAHDAVQKQPGSGEPAVPGPSDVVTKPPTRGGRDRAPRADTPAVAGLNEAAVRIAQRTRSNYRITDDDQVGVGGPRQKIRDNIEAIRTLKAIEDERRDATPGEKAILVKYVGWGAFAQDMFAPNRKELKAERDAFRSLVSDDEFNAAKGSTLNAHYTSPDVVRGMWDAISHLGYKGGLALEPAAGVGHFLGLIPDKVATKTAWTAVELDPLTGRIAKALYGNAEVNVHGFEDLKRPSNHYDLAISNVPFGNYNLAEKPYGAFPIHDFFFVKSLDKVRPGGVVAFITSRYSMDRIDPSTRRMLAKTSDLVGAIRLPGGSKGAFSGNAGTDVTTDIMFLRKKMPGEAPFPGANWMELKEIQTPEGPTKINEYFAEHPDMMLGEMRLKGTMYRDDEPVLIGDAAGIQDKIAAAARNMPQGSFVDRVPPKAAVATAATVHSNDIAAGIKDGAFFLQDGALYQRREGQGVAHPLNAADTDRVTRLVGMRDVVNDLLATQLGGGDNAAAQAKHIRGKLQEAYDAFVAEHGPINKEDRTTTTRLNKAGEPVVITRYPNIAKFMGDPDAWKVAAIENYDADTGNAKRADIQVKDVINPPMQREINGPSDALSSSLDQTGGIDLDHIAQALNLKTQEEVVSVLGDLIYQNPDGRRWETVDSYLAGNVVKKLEDARAIAAEDSSYLRNVTALEKVQPTPLSAADITAQFGAPWVPADVYKDFLTEIGGQGVEVRQVPVTGEWRSDATMYSRDARAKFGTGRVSVDKIVDAALNNRQITVRDPEDSAGNKPINEKATTEARIKIEALKEAFTGDAEHGLDGWVFADPERAQRLEAIFNRTYNNLVPRKFDGTHLTLPGLNPDFATRQHRKDSIWRMIQSGNTLLAHVVGSGKTATMIAGGMEQKRLGLINKPAYVIPNHMLEQFSREFIQAYPDAKILVASRDETTRENRKAFLAKVASNDWDGVIITHDAFGRISMGQEFRKKFIQDQLDELAHIMSAEAAKEGKNSPTVKGLEKSKKRLQGRLEALMAEERKDDGTGFEESGVDFLFVDEAHKFKNLSFITRLQRVKGLAQGDSQRAEDLFLKIRYLEQNRPGRSAVFATGTPVSNTMAELWTMQRYLQLDKLKEAGLDNFDAWASTFGRVVNNMELSADGRTFKEVSSFSKFVNVPELVSLYSEVADTKTADMLNLPRPVVKTRSGAPGIEIVEAEPSSQEEAHINKLVALAESLKGKRPEKGQPNMLSVVTEGRKVATDGRLISGDFDFNPQGKIAMGVDNIARIWKEGHADPSAPNKVQMVFLDMGVPQSKAAAKPKKAAKGAEDDDIGMDPAQAVAPRMDLYADIKKRLVEAGIPAKEIAAIHDATDDAKKARLFQRVRSGEIRVILGSSEKMGVGTNVQDRLIAMHHFDAPWKPSDVEQRDGRIVRQGNKNKEVQIYRYVTKRSFDAFMWQKLDTKSKFIGQVLSGAKGARHAEDIDNPLPEAAEMKAAASGDPRIIEHAELDRQVRALTAQRRSFEATKSRATWEAGTAKTRIAHYEEALPNAKADAGLVTDLGGDKFTAELGGAAVTDRKTAGEAILKQLLAVDARTFYTPKIVKIGKLSGFDMNMKLRGGWDGDGAILYATPSLKGKSGYAAVNDTVINAQTDPSGLIRRYENIMAGIKQKPAQLERELAAEKDSVKSLEKTLGETWPKEKEYRSTIDKLSELSKALKETKKPATAEPPIPADHVRLYRGETDTPKEQRPIPDWLKDSPEVKATIDATGRWFTRDRKVADYYNKEFGAGDGRVSFVDVPKADVDKYLAANQPEAAKFSAAGREKEEYFLPKKLAERSVALAGAADVKAQRPQTVTPEFKRWFGGSKVVDESGAPLIVYRGEHGDSNSQFHSRLGSLSFGTKDAANIYAESPNNRKDIPARPRVTPAYLKIEKPIIDTRDGDPFVDFSTIEKALGRDVATKIAAKHAGAFENTSNWLDNFSSKYDSVRDLIKRDPKKLSELYVDAYELLDDPFFVEKAKAAGYDGAIHGSNGDTALQTEYRVFSSSQVKSAIGNRGSFDPNKTDITARRGWDVAEGRDLGPQPGEKVLPIGKKTVAHIKPAERYTAAEQKIADAVKEIGDRMAPQATVAGTAALRQHGAAVWGVFVNSKAFPQLVAWSLEQKSPEKIAGTVRHEIVHHLRQSGLIRPKEWDALHDAAVKDDWIKKYNIDDRYPDLSLDHRVEEAVAEQFSEWRKERSIEKTGLIRDAFQRIELLFRRVAAAARKFIGADATANDVFTRMETGEIGRRRSDQIERQKAIFDNERVAAQTPGEENRLRRQKARELSATEPTLREKIVATSDAFRQRAADFSKKIGADEIVRSLQMKTSPMAVRDATVESRAIAKEFINARRQSRQSWNQADKYITDHFTPEQRQRMWEAADEQSVAMQLKRPTEGIGLDRLTPTERAVVDMLQERGRRNLQAANDLRMIDTEGLPSYAPRMIVRMAEGKYEHGAGAGAEIVRDVRTLALANAKLENAIAARELINAIEEVGRKSGNKTVNEGGEPANKFSAEGEISHLLDQIGRDVSTSTPQLKHRKYLTAAETEAAAGRVPERARDDNAPTWFTLNHPAFSKLVPRMVDEDPKIYRDNVKRVSGMTVENRRVPAKDEDGNIIYDRQPIYVRGDFEGPLRAVLSKDTDKLYNALMALKGKAMSVIMMSPLIHNQVEWGRALPVAPGKVLTFQTYLEGNKVANDPRQMARAIAGGVVPIGGHGFMQDLVSIAEAPTLRPGRSWTAKGLGAATEGIGLVTRIYDPKAGADQVRAAVDKAGNFWHNTLLWDRVRDLQMGLWSHLEERLIDKGYDPYTANVAAAHFANRYAGALPIEAMSGIARGIANIMLFSRSFTLGNLGAYKDAMLGLPRDAQAMIQKNVGYEQLQQIQSFVKRKSLAMLALDAGLFYATLSALQSSFNVAGVGHTVATLGGMVAGGALGGKGGKYGRLAAAVGGGAAAFGLASVLGASPGVRTLEDELGRYWERFGDMLHRLYEHPGEIIGNPFKTMESLGATAENEPGKKTRLLIGYQPDGTAIYARLAVGKVTEELIGYMTEPNEMLHRKLSTFARPLDQILRNDAGFGHKVYNPKADTPAEVAKNVAKIAGVIIGSQIPVDTIKGAKEWFEGGPGSDVAGMKAISPFIGTTVSKGYPGGPELGVLNDAKERQRYRTNEEMPGIRDQIKKGDVAGAIQKMQDLGIPRGLQSYYIKTTQNPSARLNARQMKDFMMYASPDEKREFENAQRNRATDGSGAQRAAGGRVEAGNINHEPSPAQKEAGNYAKDRVHLHGLRISIENARGSYRGGLDAGGKPWKVRMPHHYGYILGTEARDGDHVDCHIGPHTKAPHVFVIDQVDHKTGKYDEPKCMIGFANERHALLGYLAGFSDGKGKDRIGKVTAMTVAAFKAWLAHGNTKAPFRHAAVPAGAPRAHALNS